MVNMVGQCEQLCWRRGSYRPRRSCVCCPADSPGEIQGRLVEPEWHYWWRLLVLAAMCTVMATALAPTTASIDHSDRCTLSAHRRSIHEDRTLEDRHLIPLTGKLESQTLLSLNRLTPDTAESNHQFQMRFVCTDSNCYRLIAKANDRPSCYFQTYTTHH